MRWLALVMLPSAALGCPVASDLETGVEITRSDGVVATYLIALDGSIIATRVGPDFTTETVLRFGIYPSLSMISGGNVIGADTQTFYEVGAALDDPPRPGTTKRVKALVASSLGGQFPETQSYSWEDAAALTIGDCTYAGVSGHMQADRDGMMTREELFYIDELGFAVTLDSELSGFGGGPYPILADIRALK